MRQGRLQVWSFLFGIGLTVHVMAQDHHNESLTFKFQTNESLLSPRLSSTQPDRLDHKTQYRLLPTDTKKRHYDAILYYPLHRQGVSIDVGLNLRLQEEQSAQGDLSQGFDQDWLNIDTSETQALIHAAAIFDLPFSGFKAGLSGTYDANLNNFEYDYRAKLSYKWKSGFGMEGGWQHQQKSEEPQNFNDRLDVQTLFLDMKYRF